MKRSAIFSPCGNYRYQLERVWDETKPKVMCVGLNPSTANHETDDRTISKLIDILTYHGYGGFIMTNLYAIISSTTDKLYATSDPLKFNDDHLRNVARFSKDVIYCWGAFPKLEARVKAVRNIAKAAGLNEKCLGKTKHGAPVHPAFYVRRGTKPQDITIWPYDSKVGYLMSIPG